MLTDGKTPRGIVLTGGDDPNTTFSERQVKRIYLHVGNPGIVELRHSRTASIAKRYFDPGPRRDGLPLKAAEGSDLLLKPLPLSHAGFIQRFLCSHFDLSAVEWANWHFSGPQSPR